MTSSIECKNFLRSLQLLNLLIKIGVQNLILCPGSRSAPLAIAAGELNKLGLVNIFNSIDERSAGFHSLGISTASGNLSLVITTSGALKKLFNGEKLNFGITEIKLKSNFDYADLSYDVHIYSNYTLIALISLHILAALLHTFVFKDNVIKRIT